MAAQFDLFRTARGTLVVVLQNDLLDQLQTRVVAPLVPANTLRRTMPSLNPSVTVGSETYLLMPQLMATLTLTELGKRLGSLAILRDEIVRAVDALLSGI